MARHCPALLLLLLLAAVASPALGTPARRSKAVSTAVVTCPGFPGYCSESYVGDTCTVVCSRGRNNVPQCQEDGTWTDIPRCIEHDPGIEEQVTGICPGIPGYCSLDWPGAVCEFDCDLGPDIKSECTEDGTWEPYPTCQNDPRETQDGCNPCPGPDGGPRNRTAEAGGSGGGRGKAATRGNNIAQTVGHKGGPARRPGGRRGGGGRKNSGGARQGGRRNNSGQRDNLVAETLAPPPAPAPPRRPEQTALAPPPPPPAPRRAAAKSEESVARVGLQCPGDELQACIDVCPGFSARIFGACVAGCAKRCPGKK